MRKLLFLFLLLLSSSLFAQSTTPILTIGSNSLAFTFTGNVTLTVPATGTLLSSGGALGTPSSGTLTNCTFPTLNQSTTGSAATLTTTRGIYGNNFDGSTALTQIISSVYGGTGNGFTKFSGASASEKTYTLPNASAAILTDNAAVTVAQGGTGVATLALNGILYGNAATSVLALAVNSTATNKFLTQSSSNAPAWAALVSGDIPNNGANTTGSAATLTTARTINGTSFDGSANITLGAASVTSTQLDLTMAPTWTGLHNWTSTTATTNAVTTTQTFGLNSTGTTANNFGEQFLFNLSSSNTNNRNAAKIVTDWLDATDATRNSRLRLYSADVGGGLIEGMRISGVGVYFPQLTGGVMSIGASNDVNTTTAGAAGRIFYGTAATPWIASATTLYYDVSNKRLGIGSGIASAASYDLHVNENNGTTAAIDNLVGITHNSTGTPAAGFGTGILILGETSTTPDRNMGAENYTWTTATEASQVSKYALQLVNGNNTLADVFSVTGAGIANALLGYEIAGAGATGTFPRGDGTKFISSTLTIPNAGTTGDVFIATGTNAMGVVAAQATANKVLMSGASAVPTWSTPTFPNASATNLKVIKSDGTNWVASTETYAAPSTNGNVMTSDGTNWTSGFGWVTTKVASSDFTRTAQTLADITGLVTGTLSTSTNYRFHAVLYCTTSAVTTGVEFGVNITGGGSPVAIASFFGTTTTTASAGVSIATLNSAEATAYLTTSAQNGVVMIDGWFTTGTGSPAFSIQGLKVTSGTLTVKIGSFLQYQPM